MTLLHCAPATGMLIAGTHRCYYRPALLLPLQQLLLLWACFRPACSGLQWEEPAFFFAQGKKLAPTASTEQAGLKHAHSSSKCRLKGCLQQAAEQEHTAEAAKVGLQCAPAVAEHAAAAKASPQGVLKFFSSGGKTFLFAARATSLVVRLLRQ